MSASVLAAGVAADNVICAVYFMLLFALASKIPPEAAAPTTGIIFVFFLLSAWLDYKHQFGSCFQILKKYPKI